MPELVSPLPDRIAALDGFEHSLVDQTQNLLDQIRTSRSNSQRLDERPSWSYIGWPRLSGVDKRGMPAWTMHLVWFARSYGLAASVIKLLYWSNKIEPAIIDHRRSGVHEAGMVNYIRAILGADSLRAVPRCPLPVL